MTVRWASWYPHDATHAAIASPDESARSPRAPASEIVSTATLNGTA